MGHCRSQRVVPVPAEERSEVFFDYNDDCDIKILMTMTMMKKGLMTMKMQYESLTGILMTQDFVRYEFVALQDIGNTEGRGLEP